MKHQLEAQGKVLTDNLAYNAEPFIVEYNKDQLNQLVGGMLHNNLVLFAGIINTRFVSPYIDVLQKQEFVNLRFVSKVIIEPQIMMKLVSQCQIS